MKPDKQILRFQRLLERGDNTFINLVVQEQTYSDVEAFASTVSSLGPGASVFWSTSEEGMKKAGIRVQQRYWAAFLLYQKSPAVRLYAAMAQRT